MSEDVTVKELQEVIESMDGLSQTGFGQVKAIAKLSLTSLEGPECYRHLDEISVALTAIWHIAERYQDCVTEEAMNVGCEGIDEAWKKRFAACREFQDGLSKEKPFSPTPAPATSGEAAA